MTGWCKQCEKYITVDDICVECEPWCEKCYECCGSDDDDNDDEGQWCPWCMKDNQTIDQIRQCSGFKPTGMPPNQTGHPYGCGCSECRSEYQQLK